MEAEAAYLSYLPSFYRSFLLECYSQTGLPSDQINLLVIFLFNSICGSIYRRIHDTLNKLLFGLSIGLISIYALYGIRDSIALLFFICIMYPICVLIRNPTLTFWISQITLLLCFSYMYFYHYLSWRIDVTTSLMGVTIRLHTLTWDLYDADLMKKNINSSSVFGKYPKMIDFRMKHACHYQLSFFQYLSFMLFFVHIICGSNLTINEFMDISNNSIYKKNGWVGKNYPQPSWKQIGITILQLISVCCIFLFFDLFLPPKTAYNLPPSTSLFMRILMVAVIGFVAQFRYHFGFKFSDLITLTSGAAFSSVEYYNDTNKIKKIYWERAKNINCWNVIKSQCSNQVVKNWNMTINLWLTYYIFFRVSPPEWIKNIFGSKLSKILMTRICAAMFHGVYPGYYVFFMITFFVTISIDKLRSVLPTYESQGNKTTFFAKIIHFLWSTLFGFNVGLAFIWFNHLEITQVIGLMNAIYWFQFIQLIVIWIIATFLKYSMIKNIKKQS